MTFLKACLNGGRSKAEHPSVPVTAEELAADARLVADAGAVAVHVHPRSRAGSETLDAGPTGEVVTAIREACPGLPIGLTTGLWIAGGDPTARLRALERWDELPDFVSVNLSEPGWVDVVDLFRERGVGVEAGLASTDDARALVDPGRANAFMRALVEVEPRDPAAAVRAAEAIGGIVAGAAPGLPQVHHGYDRATWAVVDAALRSGHGARIGLEDTLVGRDGRPAGDNAALVRSVLSPSL